MTPGEVTVLNADGTLLASGDDSGSAAPGKLLGIESEVSKGVEESIRRTLAPYLGIGNFQSSVSTSLNTDRRQVSERIFDPESRVERSTRTIRETAQSQDSTNQAPVGVEQDVRAADETATGTGEKSVDEKDRREELTNYEINEKTISTTSDGYEVERLSIAVVINRQRILESIGENATDDQVDARIGEIEALVASASGFSSERGDQLKVTAVDFLDTGSSLEPIPSPGFGEMFMRQSGTLINALTILAVAVLLIWFGLKPAIRAIVAVPAAKDENEVDPFDSPNTDLLDSLNFDVGAAPASDDIAQMVGMDPAYLEDLTRNQATSPKARLEKLVDFDEAHAAQVLKQWIHQTQAA